MKKIAQIVAGCILGTALTVSGWTYALARGPQVRTVTKVEHVTVTRTVTRVTYRTRTSAVGNTAPCTWNPDTATLVPSADEGAGPPNAVNETCSMTVTADPPYSSGVITITLIDAAGHTTSTSYSPA